MVSTPMASTPSPAAACETADFGPMMAQMSSDCQGALISASTTGVLPAQAAICRCLAAVPVESMPGCDFGGVLFDADTHASCVAMASTAAPTLTGQMYAPSPAPTVDRAPVDDATPLACDADTIGDNNDGVVYFLTPSATSPSPKVLYRVVVTEPQLYVFNTCGGENAVDTVIYLYSLEASDPTSPPLTYNDDHGGSGDGSGCTNRMQSHMEVPLMPGTYIFVVDGYGNGRGAFTLTLSCSEYPVTPSPTEASPTEAAACETANTERADTSPLSCPAEARDPLPAGDRWIVHPSSNVVRSSAWNCHREAHYVAQYGTRLDTLNELPGNCQGGYLLRSVGNCDGHQHIDSVEECQAAAETLALTDAVPSVLGAPGPRRRRSHTTSWSPPGCFHRRLTLNPRDRLIFNHDNTTRSPESLLGTNGGSHKWSICRACCECPDEERDRDRVASEALLHDRGLAPWDRPLLYSDAAHGSWPSFSLYLSSCDFAGVCIDGNEFNFPGAGRAHLISFTDDAPASFAPDTFLNFSAVSFFLIKDSANFNLGQSYLWLRQLPSLRELTVTRAPATSAIRAGTFVRQTQLVHLMFVVCSITVVELGAFDGLTRLTMLNMMQNELTRIPTRALGPLALLKDLYLPGNRITGLHAGDIAGPWTDNLVALALANNAELVTVDPEAMANITGPLAESSSFVDNLSARRITTRMGVPISVGADGGIGGGERFWEAITINPAPVKCRWLGGAARNISCDSCTLGYIRDSTADKCVLPPFGLAERWDDAEMHRHFDGELRLRTTVGFEAPSLSADKKTGFVGYAEMDFAAISYELDFVSDVELGCNEAYTNSTTDDPPQHGGENAGDNYFTDPRFRWDLRFRATAGANNRPQYLRLEVTASGNFTFAACDSRYTVSLGLFHRNRSFDVPLFRPSTYVSFDHLSVEEGHRWEHPYGFQLLYEVEARGVPVDWYGGCPVGASAKRTVHLEVGEYVLEVNGNPWMTNTGGTYNVGMSCADGGETASPLARGDPGGLSVDTTTGAVSGTPERAGNYTMRLLAKDSLGNRAEVTRWRFEVVDLEFDTAPGWVTSDLDPDRNMQLKYHFNETHTVQQPQRTNAALFVDPANDDAASIVFLLRVEWLGGITGRDDTCSQYNENASNVLALTEVDTGVGAFDAKCIGRYRFTLTARDGGGADTVVNQFEFEALPYDEADPANGPGGAGCGDFGTPVDGAPMDGSFTCTCIGDDRSGDNCEVVSAASSSSAAGDSDTALVGGVLGAVLGVVAAMMIAFWIQVYRLKHRPFDVSAVQAEVLRSLGLTATTDIGPGQFGITLVFETSVELTEQFKEELVLALQEAVYQIKSALSDAKITNAVAAANGTSTKRVLLVMKSASVRSGTSPDSVVAQLLREASRSPLAVSGHALSDAVVAVPHRVPREIARASLTRIRMLGEGVSGEVHQYQMEERGSRMAYFVVRISTRALIFSTRPP